MLVPRHSKVRIAILLRSVGLHGGTGYQEQFILDAKASGSRVQGRMVWRASHSRRKACGIVAVVKTGGPNRISSLVLWRLTCDRVLNRRDMAISALVVAPKRHGEALARAEKWPIQETARVTSRQASSCAQGSKVARDEGANCELWK